MMICLPRSPRNSFGCDKRFDTCMGVAFLVSPLTSKTLTAKHQCNVGPSGARHSSCIGDVTSPFSSAANLQYQLHDWSRNTGFSCGSSSHARMDAAGSTFLIAGSASEEKSAIEASYSGFRSSKKTRGSVAQGTKDTLCSEPSFYDKKQSMDYEVSIAGSTKSQPALPSLLNIEENQEIRNNPLGQMPICESQAITPAFSHMESNTRLSEVTLEIKNGKALWIQSSERMQAGLEPSLDSAHWHENKSVIGASHYHARLLDADMRVQEDRSDLMSVNVHARVPDAEMLIQEDQSESTSVMGASRFHARVPDAEMRIQEDQCDSMSVMGASNIHARAPDAEMRIKEDQSDSMGLRMYAHVEVLKCHALGSGHSADCPASQKVLKEMNLARKEPINDTYNMSVVRLPVYRTSGSANWSSRLTEGILYLDSMGVDSGRLIKEEPTTMTYDIKRLRELVRVLEGLGLHWKDLGKILNLCPRIIHLCPVKDIKLVTDFLFDEVGLLPKDLSKVIKRCPRLLACDVVDQLSPTLLFLRTLGFSNMGQVVANNATLLSLDIEKKLIPKMEYLESLGFTNREVVSMANRFPALFNYNVKENLEPKYEYLVHGMGGSNKDLLAFPQYFGYSLDKRIIPRYQCITKQDVSLSIQAMLKLSEAEFIARFHDPVASSKQEIIDELCDCESAKLASLNHPTKLILEGAQR